jgi:hypothetical protein
MLRCGAHCLFFIDMCLASTVEVPADASQGEPLLSTLQAPLLPSALSWGRSLSLCWSWWLESGWSSSSAIASSIYDLLSSCLVEMVMADARGVLLLRAQSRRWHLGRCDPVPSGRRIINLQHGGRACSEPVARARRLQRPPSGSSPVISR